MTDQEPGDRRVVPRKHLPSRESREPQRSDAVIREEAGDPKELSSEQRSSIRARLEERVAPQTEDTTLPSELYWHYTDSGGLLGILGSFVESDCEYFALRASNVRYLNDATEIEYGTRCLEAVLELISEDQELSSTARREARAALSAIKGGSLKSPPIFATCFCDNGDLLSQWYGYATGSGFSMGFRMAPGKSAESTLARMDSQAFNAIQYGPDAAESLYANLRKRGKGGSIKRPIQESMFRGNALIKSEEFRNEREYRLVRVAPKEGIKLREKAGRLIPYIDIFMKVDSLECIVVGPRVDQVEQVAALREFLSKIGLDRVAVKLSRASYRG